MLINWQQVGDAAEGVFLPDAIPGCPRQLPQALAFVHGTEIVPGKLVKKGRQLQLSNSSREHLLPEKKTTTCLTDKAPDSLEYMVVYYCAN